MTEVDAPVTNSDAMEGVLSTGAGTTEPSSAPPEEEYSCETLYIQNLNEKIKPEGSPYFVGYDVNFNQHSLQFSKHRYADSSNHMAKYWTLLHTTICACEVRPLSLSHQPRLQRKR